MAVFLPGMPGFSAGAPIDWSGQYVPDSQQYYTPWIQTINGVRTEGPRVLNPNYKSPSSGGNSTPASAPPSAIFTFDTIGQTIYRSFGHCRLPIRPIWALGVNESGDTSVSSTQTWAGAVCAPIDPNEEGEVFELWDGGGKIMDESGVLSPVGWSDANLALLSASLTAMTIYPGNESQLPDPLIVADKGVDKTNAFRGLRYFVFPNYPINGGSPGGTTGLPKLSVVWRRTNDEDDDGDAVTFFAHGD